MSRHTERDLCFSPDPACTVTEFDERGGDLKTVDFLIEREGQAIILEFKDFDGPRTKGATSDPRPEIQNQKLLKQHLLPKLYGSYAIFFGFQMEAAKKVSYAVVIGYRNLDAPLRAKVEEDIRRIVYRVGPNLTDSRVPPVVQVHNIESWNKAYPSLPISRLSTPERSKPAPA